MNVLNNHVVGTVNSSSNEVKQKPQTDKKVEQKKDGKKLLLAGAVATAAIGTALVLMSKGKAKPNDVQKAGKKAVQEIANNIPQKANNVADDVAEVVTDKVDDVVDVVLPKIKDIKFDKGVAFKDGEKYTGIIEDTLKSGKKVVLEYKDGVIQKSTNNGVEKVFDHKAIKKISQNAKDQHDKLSKILADKDNLSLEDFTKQVDEIKFKSKNDLAKIDEIKSSKLKAIEEATKKADVVETQTKEATSSIDTVVHEEAPKKQRLYYDGKTFEELSTMDTVELNRRAEKFFDENPDFIKEIDSIKMSDEILETLGLPKGTTIGEFMKLSVEDFSDFDMTRKLYHGTSTEAKEKILKDGFDLSFQKAAESGQGAYFGFDKDYIASTYGSNGGIIETVLPKNFRIGKVKSNGTISYPNCIRTCDFKALSELRKRGNLSFVDGNNFFERYFNLKFKEMGYDALFSSSTNAGCDYMVVLDPSKLILK